jgi:hypothetical protein
MRPRAFHLHEGDGVAAPHHEVDLAAGRRKAPGERAIAFGKEEQKGGGLGPTAAQIGGAATLGRGRHASFARDSCRARA